MERVCVEGTLEPVRLSTAERFLPMAPTLLVLTVWIFIQHLDIVREGLRGQEQAGDSGGCQQDPAGRGAKREWL